jgi:hypothetical protein
VQTLLIGRRVLHRPPRQSGRDYEFVMKQLDGTFRNLVGMQSQT